LITQEDVGMIVKFDELRVLKTAENIADDVWKQVSVWSSFEREQ
jgi:hypothetical protein